MHAYMHTFTHTYIHTYIHMLNAECFTKYTYMHTNVNASIHAFIYTYITIPILLVVAGSVVALVLVAVVNLVAVGATVPDRRARM